MSTTIHAYILSEAEGLWETILRNFWVILTLSPVILCEGQLLDSQEPARLQDTFKQFMEAKEKLLGNLLIASDHAI